MIPYINFLKEKRQITSLNLGLYKLTNKDFIL